MTLPHTFGLAVNLVSWYDTNLATNRCLVRFGMVPADDRPKIKTHRTTNLPVRSLSMPEGCLS